jgi:hypothetical protein
MAAGKWKFYEAAKEYLGDGTIDLDSATFKMALFTSASNCNTLSGSDALADLTNEVANANGYTTGGVTLTGVTWVNSAGTMTFDCDNAIWNASGGSITSRFAVIYRSGSAGSPAVTDALLCVCLLDTTPADVTVTSGNSLTIAINAGGVFTLSGATTD